MCSHFPTCPSADRPDREAARIVAYHPSQGWALLCNGVISFDDAGEILPDGRAVARRAERPKRRRAERPTCRWRWPRDRRQRSRRMQVRGQRSRPCSASRSRSARSPGVSSSSAS